MLHLLVTVHVHVFASPRPIMDTMNAQHSKSLRMNRFLVRGMVEKLCCSFGTFGRIQLVFHPHVLQTGTHLNKKRLQKAISTLACSISLCVCHINV